MRPAPSDGGECTAQDEPESGCRDDAEDEPLEHALARDVHRRRGLRLEHRDRGLREGVVHVRVVVGPRLHLRHHSPHHLGGRGRGRGRVGDGRGGVVVAGHTAARAGQVAHLIVGQIGVATAGAYALDEHPFPYRPPADENLSLLAGDAGRE